MPPAPSAATISYWPSFVPDWRGKRWDYDAALKGRATVHGRSYNRRHRRTCMLSTRVRVAAPVRMLRIAGCAAIATIALGSPAARAQTTALPNLQRLVDRFVLDAAVVNAADLSADGRWVAGTTISTRNRIGIDNTRFQDPTYIAPAMTDVWVVETATGTRQNVFSDKRQVRGLKWSPDGSRLAMFVLKGEVFEPASWDRESHNVRPVPLPDGKEAADNAEFEWSPSGSELFFAARATAWRVDTRKRFDEETGSTSVLI